MLEIGTKVRIKLFSDIQNTEEYNNEDAENYSSYIYEEYEHKEAIIKDTTTVINNGYILDFNNSLLNQHSVWAGHEIEILDGKMCISIF